MFEELFKVAIAAFVVTFANRAASDIYDKFTGD